MIVMAWSFAVWGLLIASLFLVFAILYKKYSGGHGLGSLKPIKRKVIQFATPHRLELILLSLYFFFFFIADLCQNKFLDLGLDYNVIFFWNITLPAILLWEIFLILFHISLMALFIVSLKSKKTNNFYDIFVGILAFFGVAILLAGVVNQIYAENIYFLGLTLRSIDFYHLGIYVEVFAGLYWAFTD
jgi:hypothetical protein